MNPLLAVAVEAVIFLAIAGVSAGVTYAVIAGQHWRSFPRPWLQSVGISVAFSFIFTELWAQYSHVPRYALTTISICVVLAAIAIVIQSRRGSQTMVQRQD